MRWLDKSSSALCAINQSRLLSIVSRCMLEREQREKANSIMYISILLSSRMSMHWGDSFQSELWKVLCVCVNVNWQKADEERRKVKISSSDQQEDIDWPQSKKTRNELSLLLLLLFLLLHRTNISDLKKKEKGWSSFSRIMSLRISVRQSRETTGKGLFYLLVVAMSMITRSRRNTWLSSARRIDSTSSKRKRKRIERMLLSLFFLFLSRSRSFVRSLFLC